MDSHDNIIRTDRIFCGNLITNGFSFVTGVQRRHVHNLFCLSVCTKLAKLVMGSISSVPGGVDPRSPLVSLHWGLRLRLLMTQSEEGRAKRAPGGLEALRVSEGKCQIVSSSLVAIVPWRFYHSTSFAL
jgi:hypothetical protein